MEFVTPSIKYQTSFNEYCLELRLNNEPVIPAAFTYGYQTLQEVLIQEAKFNDPSITKLGLAQGFSYWLVEDLEILGCVNIRYHLTPELEYRGGHIGYGIRPSQRGHNLATKLLEFALMKCFEAGLSEVLLTVLCSNLASINTIKKCGGQYLETQVDACPPFDRYKIILNPNNVY